ncbi:MAG: hypothetical protein JST84_15685 [Acidobacteria bacterium]|nr:hypothetical protein [Acidobacteriota bacterium]
MNNNFDHPDGPIPTNVLKALRDHLTKIRLSAARVGADLQQAPNDRFEQLFKELINVISQAKPEKVAQLKAKMKQPLLIYKQHPAYRSFADLDLQNPTALQKMDINKIYSPLLVGFRQNYVHIASPRDYDHLTPQTEHKGLKFWLHQVKCFDETGSGWGEWGEDEIYMGAVATDENGESSSGGLFHVMDFDDGDRKVYNPPKQLQYFNIHEGGNTFPKVYTMTLALVEHDWGNLPEWFNKLLDEVKGYVSKCLASLVGVAIGSALGPLGALIGAAIGYAVGAVIGWIKDWLGDENLGTASFQATINSYSGNWIATGTTLSPIRTRDYTGDDSLYRVFCQWELIT